MLSRPLADGRGVSTLILLCLGLVLLGLAYAAVLSGLRVVRHRRDDRGRQARERVEPLAVALVDGEPAGAVRVGDEQALTEVLHALSPSLVGATRERIAEYFERSGAVDRSVRELADHRADRRATHAALLGDMCSPRAEVPLIQSLHDHDRDVRLAAARSLGRLRSRAACDALLAALVHKLVPRSVATGALLAIGAAALPGVRGLCRDDEPQARASAIALLGLMGDAQDGPTVASMLADPEPAVRLAACESLARMGGDDARVALEAALDDESSAVRAAAAAALAEVGDRASTPGLIHAAQTDDAEVAMAAARALRKISPVLALRVGESGGASIELRHVASAAKAGVS